MWQANSKYPTTHSTHACWNGGHPNLSHLLENTLLHAMHKESNPERRLFQARPMQTSAVCPYEQARQWNKNEINTITCGTDLQNRPPASKTSHSWKDYWNMLRVRRWQNWGYKKLNCQLQHLDPRGTSVEFVGQQLALIPLWKHIAEECVSIVFARETLVVWFWVTLLWHIYDLQDTVIKPEEERVAASHIMMDGSPLGQWKNMQCGKAIERREPTCEHECPARVVAAPVLACPVARLAHRVYTSNKRPENDLLQQQQPRCCRWTNPWIACLRDSGWSAPWLQRVKWLSTSGH